MRYSTSGMILNLHSDASYLYEPGAQSRVGGHYLLGDQSTVTTKPLITDSTLNGPIFTVS